MRLAWTRLSVRSCPVLGAVALVVTLLANTTPAAAQQAPEIVPGGGGAKNIVLVQNRTDGALQVRGNVQLTSAPGPIASPVNLARALSSCTGCQTFAVAMQIALVSTGARQVTPQNAAIAINELCSDCDSVALALQYEISVDDPAHTVPPRTQQLVARMRQEVVTMQAEPGLTLSAAEQRVLAVVSEFDDLAASLRVQRDESTAPAAVAVPAPGTV